VDPNIGCAVYKNESSGVYAALLAFGDKVSQALDNDESALASLTTFCGIGGVGADTNNPFIFDLESCKQWATYQ
jgi:hypothetical protein